MSELKDVLLAVSVLLLSAGALCAAPHLWAAANQAENVLMSGVWYLLLGLDLYQFGLIYLTLLETSFKD